VGLAGTTLLCALAIAAPLAAGAEAAPVEIAWDKDLAFEHDRENYQRSLREIVEQGYHFASSELGLKLLRPLKVEICTPARYERLFGTEASRTRGAHYQRGAIYVNGGNRLNDRFAGGIVHEMTHALLDYRGTIRNLPLWVNEGLAERLGFKRQGQPGLAPNQIAALQYEGREKRLVPLPTWGRATWTYLQCFAAALFFEQRAGRETMLAVVRRALQGEPFERALDRELRWSLADLEREFASWVEHLH